MVKKPQNLTKNLTLKYKNLLFGGFLFPKNILIFAKVLRYQCLGLRKKGLFCKLIKYMALLQEKVNLLLEDFFSERNDIFLLECKITPANAIHIIIDGDAGVTLEDCLAVSRKIEFNLDREEEDFSLEVTSPGATEPIRLQRQYNKNIGRELEITLQSGKIETGNLTRFTEDELYLEKTERVPKELGKGKMTVSREWAIPLNIIKSARVILQF